MERLLRKRERQGLTYRELSEQSGIPSYGARLDLPNF